MSQVSEAVNFLNKVLLICEACKVVVLFIFLTSASNFPKSTEKVKGNT